MTLLHTTVTLKKFIGAGYMKKFDFTGSAECLKCGAFINTLCDYKRASYLDGELSSNEYLHWTCGRCHYSWATQTKDATFDSLSTETPPPAKDS